MTSPRVLLAHSDGCSPSKTEQARAALEEALTAVGLSSDHYETVVVRTEEEAEVLGFVGGPAVLVDGVDVDPNVRGMRPGGLGCRAYFVEGALAGAPPCSMIEAALRAALNMHG